MKNKWKRVLAFVTAFIITLSCHMGIEPPLDYELLEDSPAFARYSGGLVYIDDKENHQCLLQEGDVLILDERYYKDPNIKICDSYRVKTYKERKEILEILCLYEEMFPSRWDRSLESMLLEWSLHNKSFFFDYEIDSSTDVDLNNADEEKYDHVVLQKLLK